MTRSKQYLYKVQMVTASTVCLVSTAASVWLICYYLRNRTEVPVLEEPAPVEAAEYSNYSMKDALLQLSARDPDETSLQRSHRYKILDGKRVLWTGVVDDVVDLEHVAGVERSSALAGQFIVVLKSREVEGSVFLRVSEEEMGVHLLDIDRGMLLTFDCLFNHTVDITRWQRHLWFGGCTRLEWRRE